MILSPVATRNNFPFGLSRKLPLLDLVIFKFLKVLRNFFCPNCSVDILIIWKKMNDWQPWRHPNSRHTWLIKLKVCVENWFKRKYDITWNGGWECLFGIGTFLTLNLLLNHKPFIHKFKILINTIINNKQIIICWLII